MHVVYHGELHDFSVHLLHGKDLETIKPNPNKLPLLDIARLIIVTLPV